MNGQGVIGPGCAWCGLPAVGGVELEPARYRSVSRRDPVTGRRTMQQVFVRAAIRAPVCAEHEHISHGQPSPVAIARQRTAQGVEQLGLFATADERLRNAIDGEIDR